MRFLAKLALTVSLAAPFAAFAACSSDDAATTTTPDSGTPETSATTDSGTAGDSAAESPGAAVATKLGCHDCHDSTAGVMAGNNDGIPRKIGDKGTFTIYPANLTPDPDTGLGNAADGWTDEQLARAIRTGVDDECETLCAAMPKFPDVNDADMAALIAYLRGLTAVKNSVDTQGCPGVADDVTGAGVFVDAGDCPAPEEDPDAGDAGDGG